jgi:phosphoglycolate phosphatase
MPNAEASAARPLPAGIRLVVYDLDGTLLDAFDDIATCINRAFAECDLPPLTPAQVKRGVGDGARKLVERCLAIADGIANAAANAAARPQGRATSADRFNAVFEAFMRHYDANPNPTVRLYDGVLDALDAVRRLGLHQAILTNKPQSVTDRTCALLGLDSATDGIWGGRPDAPLKPHPESLLQIVRHFAATPDQTAMVGDYAADCDVARAAGTRMIGVTWGIFTPEQVAAQNPDAIIDAIVDLPTTLSTFQQ